LDFVELALDIKLLRLKRTKTMKGFQEKNCPKCHSPKMKTWNELNDEQKFLVERLPLNTEFSLEQRKKHCFCERCWFEETWAGKSFVVKSMYFLAIVCSQFRLAAVYWE
jgi:hypothetical protein